MDRAPGSNASSLYLHLLLEMVLEPWAVVEVGTAKVQAAPPATEHPAFSPTERAQRVWGRGYAIFLAPTRPAACGF